MKIKMENVVGSVQVVRASARVRMGATSYGAKRGCHTGEKRGSGYNSGGRMTKTGGRVTNAVKNALKNVVVGRSTDSNQ
jgi:hypothetical protein